MNFKVLGTGSFVPPFSVTNDALSKFLDTSDEWIRKRVGIVERHVCTTETTADLAYQAAVRALENGDTDPGELDMILCATVSGEDASPAVACMVQKYLGVSCPAMDINAACSGFLFALDTAAGFFARRKVKKMLVIGAERMSRLIDWTDRSTCVIFGDGAGALLLGEGDAYITSKLHTKGGDELIKIPNYAGESPYYKNEVPEPHVYMNGPETYKFAVNALCQDLKDVLTDAGLEDTDLSVIVPHQANIRIIQAAAARLHMPMERFFVNIEKYGNTSAASIPLAIDELNRAGKLTRNSYIALCAFGGGLSSAACILRW